MGPLLLSHPLQPDTPVYPGAPSVEIVPHRLISRGDRYNSYRVSLFNHAGTHADAPRHVYEDGPSLAELELTDFFFQAPIVVNLPVEEGVQIGARELSGSLVAGGAWDFVAIRTGFGRAREEDPAGFSAGNPGLSPDGARWLIESLPSLRGIGLDVISVTAGGLLEAGWRAHRILLDPRGRIRLVVEDMRLPAGLPPLRSLMVMPLFVRGIDSSWCTVIGYPGPAHASPADEPPGETAPRHGQSGPIP